MEEVKKYDCHRYPPADGKYPKVTKSDWCNEIQYINKGDGNSCSNCQLNGEYKPKGAFNGYGLFEKT